MQWFACFPQFADGDLQEAEDAAALAMGIYEGISNRRVCIV